MCSSSVVRCLVVVAWLVVILAAAALAGPAAAGPLRFFAVGDLPYSSAEADLLERLLERAAAEEPAFIVHVGDIKGGGQLCTDARNRALARLFRDQPVPVVYTPGDNEWTDCHRAAAGGLDPLARLAGVRRVFFGDPGVLHNRALGLRTPQPEFPENAWFIRDDVLFVVLHVVGSNNAWQPRIPARHAAFQARADANRALLAQALRAGKGAGVRAAVLIFHANPVFEQPRKRGFVPFKQDLQRLLARFDGAVLLIHGDTHSYKFDRPMVDPASAEPIARVQRLEVPGSPIVAGVWVSIDLDAEPVFNVRTVLPSASDDWLER
jgi:hypothetical protein